MVMEPEQVRDLLEEAKAEGWHRVTASLPPVGERVEVMHVLNRSYDTTGEIDEDGGWQCCNAFILPNMMLVFAPTHWRATPEKLAGCVL